MSGFMRAIAPPPDLMRGADRASRQGARACKKPSGGSDVHGESSALPRLPPPPRDDAADETLYQAGTKSDEPFRHTRLKAAFVAQVLGQMMEDRATPPPSAAAAYQAAEPRLARLFDRKS
jgi:hypothetical protein